MSIPKKENWRVWYWVVLIMLILQIAAYYWFTQHFK